jgi:hypothetical protein
VALRATIAAAAPAESPKANLKILTSCPSCLQGLQRYKGDLASGLLEADYIVVEMANRILGDGLDAGVRGARQRGRDRARAGLALEAAAHSRTKRSVMPPW